MLVETCETCQAAINTETVETVWHLTSMQIAIFLIQPPDAPPEDYYFCSRSCCAAFLDDIKGLTGGDVSALELDAIFKRQNPDKPQNQV